MKLISKLIKVILLTCFLYTCSEDLLDNSGQSGSSQPTQFLTSAQTERGSVENPALPSGFVTGIYSLMIQAGSGGTTGHDDFGHKGYDIYTDMMSGDMALSISTYGWYQEAITEYQAMLNYTDSENRMPWRFYYRIVRAANTIIENLGGEESEPESNDGRFSKGQAKVLRAFAYFYLTQFYQKEYRATEEILPLYTESINGNVPKSTAEEIYDLMEKDLNDAILLLENFNRSDKSQVNQDIARTILAYVLGARGENYSEMAMQTQAVIDAGNFTLLEGTEVTNGFNNIESDSWMWGIDLTETIGLGLISWWGQVDTFSYSYAWAGDIKAIDESLYDQIPEDDVRKEQFLDNSASFRHLQPLFKFYATEVIGGVSQIATADYVFMRIEEVYLLNAEANARAGNEAEARLSLKALLEKRMPDVSFIDNLSGEALLDEIYLQTRIEMWGEGKSFLALKRFKKTVLRGSNHLSFVGEPIPYNDERLQFEIPIDEIQNNPFITGQND